MNEADIKTTNDSLFICEKWPGAEVYPYRVADIQGERLVPFVPDRKRPFAFENRNRLMPFHAKGPVFCAKWKTKLHDTDPAKDYILSVEMLPLQIYGINNQLANLPVEEISCRLNLGVPDVRVICHPVFFVSRKLGVRRNAVLCTPDDVRQTSDGGIRLKVGIYTLPCFCLSRNQMIEVSTGVNKYLYYFRCGNLDLMRDGVCPTTSRYDQVRDYIRMRLLNKANLKETGATRAEMQRIRNVFESLKPKIDSAEIASTLSCSVDEARFALDAVCRDVDQLAEPNEIDETFAKGLIDSCGTLSRHFMKVWEETHEADLVAAKKEMAAKVDECQRAVVESEKERDRQVADSKKAIAELKGKVVGHRTECARIEEEIRSKQLLLEGVRRETEGLLAQSHEAIARMLVMAETVKVVNDTKPHEASGGRSAAKPARSETSSFFRSGKPLDSEQIQDDAELSLLQDNLEMCGIIPEARTDLAAVLLAAYRLRTPILLAGPNGRAIADSLSCVVDATMADELACEGNVDAESLSEAFSGDDGILAIRGGLNSSWTECILETLGETSRMPIFLLPLSDDLVMMPKGILDYAVSIDTQPIVSESVRGYEVNLFGKKSLFPKEDGLRVRLSDENQLRKVFRCSLSCESNLRRVAGLAATYRGAEGLSQDFMYSVFYYAMARILDSAKGFNEYVSSHKGIAPLLQRLIPEEET